ncbi:MAG: hypothetical protein ABI770_03900 [Sphingomicrobium sp.]
MAAFPGIISRRSQRLSYLNRIFNMPAWDLVPAFGESQTQAGTQMALQRSERMPHYFFDTRNDDDFIEDDVGLELPDLKAVKEQAALSLAELARDVLPGSMKRTLTVEVRDERQPVMVAKLLFEAIILVPSGQ